MRSLMIALTALAVMTVPVLADEEIFARSADKLMMAADADKNGSIDQNEHTQWVGGLFADQGADNPVVTAEALAGAGLELFDDGTSRTRTEFLNDRAAAFAASDADGDGALDAAETREYVNTR